MRHLFGTAVIAALAMASGGCEKTSQQSAPPAPPRVVVEKVQRRDVVPYEIRTGTLSANQNVTILPRVSAFVETIPFSPGQFIKPGTVLFTLDSKPYKSQLDQSKATLDVRKSDLEVRKADLTVAQARLQNANEELDRQERLNKQQATSEKELMNARNNQRAASASVEAATAAVAAGKSAVEAAVASVAAAQVNVDYCTITSPIAGKVDTNKVDVGDLVNPTGQTALTTVREIDPIKVDFALNESLVVFVLQKFGIDRDRKTAVPVKISIGDQNDFKHDATLDFVSNSLDQATGTIPVQATAKNPNLRLFPGLFVRVKLDLVPLPDALLIREGALSRDIGGDFVWLVKPDATAEKRYVKLGPLVEGLRVVETGLAPDDTYVIQGIQRVRDRAKLAPQPAGEPAATRPVR